MKHLGPAKAGLSECRFSVQGSRHAVVLMGVTDSEIIRGAVYQTVIKGRLVTVRVWQVGAAGARHECIPCRKGAHRIDLLASQLVLPFATR